MKNAKSENREKSMYSKKKQKMKILESKDDKGLFDEVAGLMERNRALGCCPNVGETSVIKRRLRSVARRPKQDKQELFKQSVAEGNGGIERIEISDTDTEEKPNEAKNKVLCYPSVNSRVKVPLYIDDYKTLGGTTFLNDSIIDFYILYLREEILKDEDAAVSYFFNTWFYKKLREADGGYEAVASWTKDVQIFEKNFIIIPINENSHWYTIIICFPGEVNRHPKYFKPSSQEKKACMLVFDSLGGDTTRDSVKTLRQYLSAEHTAKCGSSLAFDESVMPADAPIIPEQNNLTECGLYLLQYIESFFSNPIMNFTLPLTLEQWFDQADVQDKRRKIADIIKEKNSRCPIYSETQLPRLRFNSNRGVAPAKTTADEILECVNKRIQDARNNLTRTLTELSANYQRLLDNRDRPGERDDKDI